MASIKNSTGLYLASRGTGEANFPALVKYVSNPVITQGAGGSWEDVDVAAPDVKWDTLTDQWVMNYSGYDGSTWKTGLAYSDDLLTWTKEATNPVFAPTGGEGYIAANGSIIEKSGTYYLYYQGGTASARIYCATSPDMLNWTRANSGNPVINVGAGGQWDDTQTFDPRARIWPDLTIEVFYGGDDGSGQRAIGHATSTDGVTFTKQGKIMDSIVGDIDANFGAPAIFGNELDYVMYHDSSQDVGYRFISRAWTVNSGSSFTHDWAVLTHGGVGTWESAQVFDASPIYYNGTLYLFYCGATAAGSAENMDGQIGLARAAWPFRRLRN